MAGRRKLVGSAQLRERGVLLQHGSLLLTADQGPTVELLKVRRHDELHEPPAALDSLLPRLPTWHELVDGLASGFERLLGIQLEESQLTPAEKSQVVQFARHFADPEWTWRL